MKILQFPTAERTMELNYRKLLEQDEDMAKAYQDYCLKLIKLASGVIQSDVTKLLIINGRPARDYLDDYLPPVA